MVRFLSIQILALGFGVILLPKTDEAYATEKSAPSYQLFLSPGEAHPEYVSFINGIIARGVGAKSTLRFSEGGVARNASLVAVGNSSLFFGVTKRKVLRIARFQGLHFEGSHQDHLNSFLDGYEFLHQLGIPVVKVFPELSRRGEFVVEELLRPDPRMGRLFSLSEYESGAVQLSKSLQIDAELSLIDFARKSYKIARFGDQNGSQVLFTTRGWVLADYTDKHVLADPLAEDAVIPFGLRYPSGEFPVTQACALRFSMSQHPQPKRSIKRRAESHLLPVPRNLLLRIQEVILNERKKANP